MQIPLQTPLKLVETIKTTKASSVHRSKYNSFTYILSYNVELKVESILVCFTKTHICIWTYTHYAFVINMETIIEKVFDNLVKNN